MAAGATAIVTAAIMPARSCRLVFIGVSSFVNMTERKWLRSGLSVPGGPAAEYKFRCAAPRVYFNAPLVRPRTM